MDSKTMLLPVKLAESDVAVRAQELATAICNRGEAEDRLDNLVEASKASKKEVESEIAEHGSEARRLARIVRERKEDRDIPVRDDFDHAAGVVNTIRVDTSEVVGTRGMTFEERQRPLDFKAGKAV